MDCNNNILLARLDIQHTWIHSTRDAPSQTSYRHVDSDSTIQRRVLHLPFLDWVPFAIWTLHSEYQMPIFILYCILHLAGFTLHLAQDCNIPIWRVHCQNSRLLESCTEFAGIGDSLQMWKWRSSNLEL